VQKDFHYEYTQCDADGGRWRVSVPKPNVCIGGAPNPPVRGKGCGMIHTSCYTYADSDVISLVSMPTGFRRHLVGKTPRNVCYLNTLCWQVNDHTDTFTNQRIEFYLNNTVNFCPLTPRIIPCYTHKMATIIIVIIDTVTSLHRMYWHSPNSMRSRVYETVRCPSPYVRLSVCCSRGPLQQTCRQQTRCCRFAAVGPAVRRYRSIVASAGSECDLHVA